MESLKNDDKINNEKIKSLDKDIKSGYSLEQMKESIKTNDKFINNLKNTTIKYKDINSLLDFGQNKNYSLFETGYKSDDEENIQEQNDIYQIMGRKAISKLDNDEIEQNENLEYNSEKVNDMDKVIEKWKYEKILIDNNIIDFNCKLFFINFFN